MKPAEFLKYRMSVIINCNGVYADVYRNKKNSFGEQSKEKEFEIKIKGIFHETTGWQSLNKNDGNVIYSVPKQFFLCMWDDAEKIKPQDHFVCNGTEYIVNAVNNVQEYNAAADISLDEVVP